MMHRKLIVKKGDDTYLFLEFNDSGIKAKKEKGKGTVYAWKTTLEHIQRIIDGYEKNGNKFKGGNFEIIYAVREDLKADENLETLLKDGKIIL